MSHKRVKRQRLIAETLEPRRLLACTASVIDSGTFPGHEFAITSVTPSSIAQTAGQQASFDLSGNIRRVGGIPFTSANHNGIANLEIAAIGGVTSSLVSSPSLNATSTQANFVLRVTASLGRSTFSYQVAATRPTGRVQLNVADASGTVCVNQRPIANDDPSFTTQENDNVSGNLLTNDTDASADDDVDDGNLFVSRVDGSSADVGNRISVGGGSLTVNDDGTFIFEPGRAFDGLAVGETQDVTFTYNASDGIAESAAAVTIEITGVNDPPAAGTFTYNTAEDTVLTVPPSLGLRAITDDPDNPDADLTFALASDVPPADGTLTLNANDGSFVFEPAMDFNGQTSFEFTASDGQLTSQSAVVTITVDSKIDAPTILNFSPDTGVIGDGVTNAMRVSFSGTSEASTPGSEVSIEIFRRDNDQLVATAITGGDGNWTSELSAASQTLTPDGIYSFYAVATESDAPNDPSPQSDDFTLAVDTLRPIISSDSILSELRGTPVSEPIDFEFPEPVGEFELGDVSLTKQGGSENLITTAASVTLDPANQDVDGFANLYRLDGLGDATQLTGTYTLSVAATQSEIVDRADNPLQNDFSLGFAVDQTLPTFAMAPTLISPVVASPLPVPILEADGNGSATVSYRVAAIDQQFTGFDNAVTFELVDVATDTVLDRQVSVPIAAGAFDNLSFSLPAQVLESPLGVGQHDLQIVLRDSVGNEMKLATALNVFVSQGRPATLGATSTPVFSETFFIGATVLEVRPNETQIVVDQQIPAGFSINLAATSATIKVNSSTTDFTTNRTTLTLDTTANILNEVTNQDKVAWLRPWQMSFDKTTQTVWFTLEDGHQLGQFDPATGSVEIHDISIPSKVVRNADGFLVPAADAKPTAFDPHGVFFDFNTHLTPRVWFVYRNQLEGGAAVDDAPPNTGMDENLRVSYYDVAQKKLFTFDFEEIAGQFDLEEHHDEEDSIPSSTGGGGNGGGNGNGSGGTAEQRRKPNQKSSTKARFLRLATRFSLTPKVVFG